MLFSDGFVRTDDGDYVEVLILVVMDAVLWRSKHILLCQIQVIVLILVVMDAVLWLLSYAKIEYKNGIVLILVVMDAVLWHALLMT